MPNKVLIFGKDAWPYTRAARAAFAKDDRQVDYFNVVKETRHLETMLEYSNGTRKVPVIVEGETVTIGFEGDTWGIWFLRLEAGEGIRNSEWGMRKVDEAFVIRQSSFQMGEAVLDLKTGKAADEELKHRVRELEREIYVVK